MFKARLNGTPPIIIATETKIFAAIAAAVGISPIIPAIVHEADTRITADEMAQNMHEVPEGCGDDPLGITCEFWEPGLAKKMFLDEFLKYRPNWEIEG